MAISAETFVRLTEHVGMFEHGTNIGVIFNTRDIILVDSGPTESDGALLEETLRSLFPDRRITAVILTHCHADHSSGAVYLASRPGVSIWASRECAHIMALPAVLASLYCGGAAINEFDTPQFRPRRPVEVKRILGDERIELEDVTLSIYPLPGHFFDQIGILVRDKADGRAVFFLGDGFFGVDLLSRAWIPFLYNQRAFCESIRKIESIPADFYVPAHGAKCTRDAVGAVAEMNIMVCYEFEDLILRIIGERPSSFDDILKAVADYSSIKLKVIPSYLIGTTLRSYISCLEHEGRVLCRIENNKLVWSKTE